MWPFSRKPAAAPAQPERIEPTISAPPVRRNKRAYGGALVNRLTADWTASSASADAELNTSLRILRNRSRQILRDYDFARSARRSIVNNVVGVGVKLQMQIPMLRGAGKLHTTLNDTVESAWAEWCRPENCHVAGRLCFSEIESLALSSIIESGEVLVRRITTERFGRSRYPFALEIIEADQLADTHNGEAANGNQIRMGVEVDRWGRPVAYYVHNSHPGDFQFSSRGQRDMVRIPADEIRHIFLTERPGQTRGIPWFSVVLNRVRQTMGYEEAEVVAARVTSCSMGVITSPGGAYPADGEDEADGLPTIDMTPGTFERLAPGEEVTFNTPTRPGGTYEPFVRAQNRGLAAGLGVSYEDATGDYSQTNYSSSRLALLNTRDNWRRLQSWLISSLHQWAFEGWLEQAVAWGALDLPDFKTNRARYAGATRWRPRGWSWIDPSKEVDATIKSIRSGLTTLGDAIGEQGGDLEETLNARRAELDLIKALDLSLTSDPEKFTDQGQEQTDPAAPASDSTQQESSDGTGDKAPAAA